MATNEAETSFEDDFYGPKAKALWKELQEGSFDDEDHVINTIIKHMVSTVEASEEWIHEECPDCDSCDRPGEPIPWSDLD